MSAPVDSLSIKVDASARGANQQLDKLVQKMMQLRSSVNGIKVGNLNTMADSIQNFSKAASGLSQVKTSDFTRMAKSIEKLSNIRKGELNRAATAITNISKSFSGIGNVSDGANKIAQLAQGISKLGYKSTTQAIQNIPLLTKELKNMMSELSKAPTVSNNLIAMTNAMANLGAQASGIRSLGSAMNSSGTRGNGFFGTMKKGISNIKSFASNIRSATTHNRSFASTLGLLYAKFWTLQRAIGAFGKAVKSSMDYIEEYNYFNVTMEKIASEWSKDFEKYGYENADAYGKSFQDRLTKVMNKMTGFQMNDDGTLTDSGIKNLGLDVTQMTNYAAGVAQVTNSVGLTGEASVVTSKALSMLAGDMSSFRNLDMSTVMTNFSSGLIGQSRALYKYGIDITNATLATYAHEMGIKKDISAMTQGEKMQLRMIAILDQSKVAWGDLAKTINSPSNQLRLLQNNFKALARTIGNMFLPVVTKVLPYVNGLVIAIRRLFEWTASMLGIKLDDVIGNSGGGYSDAFEGLEEDADNAKESVDDTTDSVKKLAKQLMGFDELNVITTNQNSSSNNNGDNGDSAPIDLTDKLSAALADYEKVWNKAYKDMTNDAEKFANKLTKLFKDAWTSGDGTDIGTAIATWINKGIKWVNDNVDTFAAGLKKMAGIMATSFNGFVAKLDWEGLGTAIGKSLKAFFDAETHFFDTVNWTNFGKSLATSANAAISTGVIQSYIKSIASKLKAAIETAFGAVTTFKFDNLGKALGEGMKDFFNTMGEVNKETGLNGWQELGVTITKSISGISVSMATALKEADIGKNTAKAIVDLLGSVDTGDIGWNIGGLVSSLVTEFYNLVSDKTMWTELGNKIADGINEFFKSMNNVNDKTHLTGWQTLGKSISKTIIGLGDSIITALDGVDWPAVGQGIGDAVKNIDFVGVAWKFVNIGGSIFGAVVDALTDFIKTAPATSAFVAAFGVLKLTGLDTKISSLITIFLRKHNLTLGKAVIGIGLAAATFRLADSNDKIKRLIGAPIAAALATMVITGNITLSLKISAVTFAITGGFSLGQWIGEKISKAIESEDMSEYRYEFKFSDLFTYSPAEWFRGIKSWWKDFQKTKLGKAGQGNGLGAAIPIGLKIGTKVKDFAKGIVNFIKGTPKRYCNVYMKIGTTVKDFKKGIKSLIKKSVIGTAAKIIVCLEFAMSAKKAVIDFINKVFIKNMNKINFKFPEFDVFGKKVGGWKFGFSIPEIKGYKFGGFPQQGQYFLARENGPELVGTIGGKTAVANNNQIVQSVSDGVFNALAPVLTQVVNAVNDLQANSNNGKPLYVEGVSDGDIVRITTRANSNHKKRYGRPLYV